MSFYWLREVENEKEVLTNEVEQGEIPQFEKRKPSINKKSSKRTSSKRNEISAISSASETESARTKVFTYAMEDLMQKMLKKTPSSLQRNELSR